MEKSLIKYWLSKNNMSQKELAKKLGINENTLSLKINGSLSTTTKDALKICEILHIDNLEERAKIFLN
ncbi:MAG: helix-turn-helix transcriptional regulator [Holdemanella biformis]|uniref:helix-turn-helix transcriptional regulator n=1 Tax=Holdemanella biformis TaxID=1735 RepID=UPI00242FF35F|nr:helix-turn-helix transcriptional regulator [Holdemanella biformis]MBS6455005.1 helix-turn-helix transcriptional regulator [Holdemanella biformis]